MNTSPTLVDTKAAAEALGVTVSLLKKDRCTHRRVPFYKIGGSCRYDLVEVRRALQQGGMQPAAS